MRSIVVPLELTVRLAANASKIELLILCTHFLEDGQFFIEKLDSDGAKRHAFAAHVHRNGLLICDVLCLFDFYQFACLSVQNDAEAPEPSSVSKPGY